MNFYKEGEYTQLKNRFEVNSHNVILNSKKEIITENCYFKYAEIEGKLYTGYHYSAHNKGAGSMPSICSPSKFKTIKEYILSKKEELIEYFSEYKQDLKTLKAIELYFFNAKQQTLF